MRLLDQVAGSCEAVVVRDAHRGDIWQFPGTDVIAAELVNCPLRYILHDDVTATCTELAFEDDTILGSSLELIRIPAPKLWLEFRRGARNGAFTAVERMSPDAEENAGQRIGLFVTAGVRGRSGSIEVCWEHPDGMSPELAPFVIEYDLDDGAFSKTGPGDGCSCLGASITDFPAIQPLYDRVRFRLRPEWQRYYQQKAVSRAHYQSLLVTAVRPLLEDVPFVALFCLLLASGGAFRQMPVAWKRLNVARTRRGRAPLLDHVEVSMHVLGHDAAGSGEGMSEGRSPPRLHFVRGHLVRRGASVHWRTSHIRGKANSRQILSRTVSLKIISPGRADRPATENAAIDSYVAP